MSSFDVERIMIVDRHSPTFAITPFLMVTCMISKSYVKLYKSSHYIFEKHIILNVKSKEDKKVLKLPKFFLMHRILRWRIEK